MSEETPKRPWLAAVLAFVYPGLGHIYLRSWARAILWFSAILITAFVFIPQEILEGIASPGDVMDAANAVPTDAAFALSTVIAINVIDAYLTARRGNRMQMGARCPSCGREIDEDLSFCHWCTVDLSEEPASNDA